MQQPLTDNRKIIHVDMDAFYPSVELLDHPELQNQPIVVGGSPEKRGVVASANYIARQYGIRSAMATRKAKELCPHAIFLRPRFEKYREVSQTIHQIFHQHTDWVEAIALDEAWLDVTQNPQQEPSATKLAILIKQQIYDATGLTASAGVSYNKFLAKIASDENKPNGLFVIPPNHASAFLEKLSLKKIPGVGKVTFSKLQSLGLHTGHDLLAKELDFLFEHFGKKQGQSLYQRVRGIDLRPVVSTRERKSISQETTFEEDVKYGDWLKQQLQQLAEKSFAKLQEKELHAKTLTLKIKFANFDVITRSQTSDEPLDLEVALHWLQKKLWQVCHEEFVSKPIRLIGAGFSGFCEPAKHQQLEFEFDTLT